MMTYNRVSSKYLESTINKDYYSLVADPCYNLSAILGDLDGYMPGSIAKSIASLSIVSPGIVILSGNIESVPTTLLPAEHFYNELAWYSYQIYTKCLSNDLSIIAPGSSKEYSRLITLALDLSPNLQACLYTIYLESFALYTELAHLDGVMELISRNDIARINNNLCWASSLLEYKNSPNYELISILRDLERTLLYISSLSSLYSSTYSKEIEEYNQWVGGIDYD